MSIFILQHLYSWPSVSFFCFSNYPPSLQLHVLCVHGRLLPWIIKCIKRYNARLDGRQISALCFAVDVNKICEVRTGCMQDTALGTLIKRLWHWDARSAADSFCNYRDTYSSFARHFEEVGYERRISDILDHLQASPFSKWLRELAELFGFVRPYNRI